jgi:hypothetical protein
MFVYLKLLLIAVCYIDEVILLNFPYNLIEELYSVILFANYWEVCGIWFMEIRDILVTYDNG